MGHFHFTINKQESTLMVMQHTEELDEVIQTPYGITNIIY